MILKSKTQSDMDKLDDKLNYIRASYFQGLLTDGELIAALIGLGYGKRGALVASVNIRGTGELQRARFKANHESLY